jgi:cell division protein FtsW (lipid II flippase)
MKNDKPGGHFDFLLFGAVIILCTFGVAMIRSAAAGNAAAESGLPRQMIFIAISLMVILITAASITTTGIRWPA